MPFAYDLFLTNQAKKELSKIKRGNPKAAREISEALEALKYDPHGGKFLHGDLKGRRKLVLGNYRVIYEIIKQKLIIYVFRIAHRKEVYR